MLSGAHMTLAPLVVEEVRKRGRDIPVIVGGIVPDHDLDELRSTGVAAILTPGATAEQIVARPPPCSPKPAPETVGHRRP